MIPDLLGFRYRFLPVAGDPRQAPTLLLLHGTGGNEDDLLGLGRELLPGANLLSPRGKVLENGMPRFFRRLAEGVFDEEDLRLRTHELADFVAAAADSLGLDAARVIAVGFSNGANIAAALLLLRPEALSGAVLLRAMVPLEPERLPDLTGRRVLMCEGRHDPIVPRDNAERLAEMLRQAGAEVTLAWQEGGHALLQQDIRAARAWLGPSVRNDPA
ncbi:MAG TPA: alpha/beta hydrolase [Chthonomonadaceae bacterium]|nr:alpha/beta hydrolase [Chthonomonadaceae bacterium]